MSRRFTKTDMKRAAYTETMRQEPSGKNRMQKPR
ncbi:hypothetical protein ABIA18_004975 [Sinorhizobium fredii]